MPNRYLRQSFIESERVNSISRDAELFWLHLLVNVDDFGRCEANPELLRARLFPLRLETTRKASVTGWLTECEQAQLVRRYEVAGKQYLQMERWERGRASDSKYPPPPISANGCKQLHTNENICMQASTDVPDPDPDPDPDKTPKPPWQGDFDRFWEAYPSKVGRRPTEEKWAKKKPPIEEILAALRWQREMKKWKDGIIPNPLTYINQERWKDQPLGGFMAPKADWEIAWSEQRHTGWTQNQYKEHYANQGVK